MKKSINGFLVVEGQADKAFLSSFLDCEIVVLGGFAIPHGTITYIKELSKKCKMLLLCDPDEAGEIIRKRVNDLIPETINLSLNFSNRKNYKKHGVAESDKESVLMLLQPYIGNYNCFTNINLSALLDIESKYGCASLEKIGKQFHLGTTNKKTMIQRLKMLNICSEEVYKLFYGN